MQCGQRLSSFSRRRSLASALTTGWTPAHGSRTGYRSVHTATHDGTATTTPPPPPPSAPASPLLAYQRLVTLAAKDDWATALAVMVGDASTTASPHTSSEAGQLISLLLFYGHRDGAYAAWRALERAALQARTQQAPHASDAMAVATPQQQHQQPARSVILQLAAYALLVDDAAEHARDVLLLDSWVSTDQPTHSPEASDKAGLEQLLVTFLTTRIAERLAPPHAELAEVAQSWHASLAAAAAAEAVNSTSSTSPYDKDGDQDPRRRRRAVQFLGTLYTQRERTGLDVYRALVQNVLVPLKLVAPWHPFVQAVVVVSQAHTNHSHDNDKDEVGSSASVSVTADAADPQALRQLQLHCATDTGDWEQALAVVDAAFAQPPLRALRLCLRACEAVERPGAAWCGALAAWARYAPLCASPPAATPPTAATTTTKESRERRPRRQQRGRARSPASSSVLTGKDVGRVLTLLAHAGKGREAQGLFEALPVALVDEYNVVQLLFAVTAPAQTPPRQADALLRAWASWRCLVGNAAAPTPRMIAVLLRRGVRGTADEARAMTALVKLGATHPAGTDAVPLNFESSEEDVCRLLRDRWEGSWQEALRVAIASQRPALYEIVAQHSSLHPEIYRAAMHAAQTDKLDLSESQRLSLLSHLNAATDVRAAVEEVTSTAVAEAAAMIASSSSSSTSEQHARRRRVDWASSMLDQLLGKEAKETTGGGDDERASPLP